MQQGNDKTMQQAHRNSLLLVLEVRGVFQCQNSMTTFINWGEFCVLLTIYKNLQELREILCFVDRLQEFKRIEGNFVFCWPFTRIYKNWRKFCVLLTVYNNLQELRKILCFVDRLQEFTRIEGNFILLTVYKNLQELRGILFCWPFTRIYKNWGEFCVLLTVYNNLQEFRGILCFVDRL